MFPLVILAGGLATRLRPITETIPKAMVLINKTPFITHQLELLKRNDITDVIMCIGYLGEQIIDFIGDGKKYGLKISYVFDGPTLLGTGGAIRNALNQLPENFFVINGDSYLPCDYRAVQNEFIASNKKALMTVFKNEGLWDTSNVEFSKGNILKYDKKNKTSNMLYIDYGLEVFSRQMFENIPEGEYFDLEPLYQQLIKDNQLAAYEVYERFYENGSFSGIKELEQFLQNHSVATA